MYDLEREGKSMRAIKQELNISEANFYTIKNKYKIFSENMGQKQEHLI